MTWFWVGKERDEKIEKTGNLELGEIAQPMFYPKQVYLKMQHLIYSFPEKKNETVSTKYLPCSKARSPGS